MEEELKTAPPLSQEEKTAKAGFFKILPILVLSAITFMAITGGLCLSGTMNLAGRTTTLPTFADRLQFTLKYQTLPCSWLLVLIIGVMLQRNKTGALDPLGGREIWLKKQANILQNSYEQFILSAFAQFILVSFIDEEWTLRTIPLINYLLFIGRVTFYFGYPSYRMFGMIIGFFPSAGMIGVGLYKFFEQAFG